MKLSELIEGVTTTTDAIGKLLWVSFGLLVAIALGTGNPGLLGLIKNRLISAGISTVNTPFGDIDLKQLGTADKTSQLLGTNAAYAAELAERAEDPEMKQGLKTLAAQMLQQQEKEIEAVRKGTERTTTKGAIAASGNGDVAVGWIYLGRLSEGQGRPPSFTIDKPGYPLKAGDRIVIKLNTVLNDSVDCKVTDVADFNAGTTAPTPMLIKPGETGLEQLGTPTQCDSIGGAKAIWVKVKVPAHRLIREAP